LIINYMKNIFTFFLESRILGIIVSDEFVKVLPSIVEGIIRG